MIQTKVFEKYFFFSLLLATLLFTFFVFKPFLIVLILGASFAVVLHPIDNWFKKKLSGWFSAFLTVALFVILICGPLFAISTLVFNQSQNVYQSLINNGNITPAITHLSDSINNFLPTGVTFNLNQKISDFVYVVTNNLAQIFSTTLSAIFLFILLLLSIFYFLKDGKKWKDGLLALSPLSDADDQKIINRLVQTISGVIQGSLLVALIQGILTSIGFAIFHVPNGALWGIIAAIAALIPPLGTGLVTIPAIIFLYVTGHTFNAVGLAIWAGLLVGLIDNFLSPFIIGKKVQIPALLILFSVLGGISLLGPVGILIGPLAVSLLYTLVSMYRNEFRQGSIL